MTYAVIEQPSAEPLTLAQVKAHLRVEHTDEDGLLSGLISIAGSFWRRRRALPDAPEVEALSRSLAEERRDSASERSGAKP